MIRATISMAVMTVGSMKVQNSAMGAGRPLIALSASQRAALGHGVRSAADRVGHEVIIDRQRKGRRSHGPVPPECAPGCGNGLVDLCRRRRDFRQAPAERPEIVVGKL